MGMDHGLGMGRITDWNPRPGTDHGIETGRSTDWGRDESRTGDGTNHRLGMGRITDYCRERTPIQEVKYGNGSWFKDGTSHGLES